MANNIIKFERYPKEIDIYSTAKPKCIEALENFVSNVNATEDPLEEHELLAFVKDFIIKEFPYVSLEDVRLTAKQVVAEFKSEYFSTQAENEL